MRVVIDANRIMAALIKDSTTRKIFLKDEFEFIAPEHVLSEIRNHTEAIK